MLIFLTSLCYFLPFLFVIKITINLVKTSKNRVFQFILFIYVFYFFFVPPTENTYSVFSSFFLLPFFIFADVIVIHNIFLPSFFAFKFSYYSPVQTAYVFFYWNCLKKTSFFGIVLQRHFLLFLLQYVQSLYHIQSFFTSSVLFSTFLSILFLVVKFPVVY